MTDKLTEADLIAEARNGSREALGMLYELHQRRVFSVALNFFGGRRELAEDVTQQVFIKIFAKINDFRADAEFTTWVYRMTINACIDEQRKWRRFFSIDALFGELRSKRAPDTKLEKAEISDEVQRAIGTLKEQFRLPILLKYSEGLSYEEIAKVLDCSIGTISSRMNRGHQMLAKKLKHLR